LLAWISAVIIAQDALASVICTVAIGCGSRPAQAAIVAASAIANLA
jgi:hypothetical protein